jgi:hypothetical protein
MSEYRIKGGRKIHHEKDNHEERGRNPSSAWPIRFPLTGVRTGSLMKPISRIQGLKD